MKKILMSISLALIALVLVGCGKNNKLYILNWGDYINEDLIAEFEKENECEVIYDLANSNETMYTNIVNKKAKYDIVVPSDYMIEKLYKDDLLKEIDKTKLTNYKEGMFIDKLQERIDSEGKDYKNFFVPYFWGTLGLMYNTSKEGVKEAVEANGFKVLFDQTVLPTGSKVGMYDCARDAFASAELYKGYSLNTTVEEELTECKNLLKNAKYDMYGDDDLKVSVANGNLDVALVYSGDFFDQRYEYIEEEKEVNFGLYAPTSFNNVFYDGMVIPTTSRNTDLAHKFIDFFLDTDNSFANTDYVGYAPVIEDVLDIFIDCADPESNEYDEYYEELLSIDAFNPSLVTKGEVYKYISSEFDAKLEEYYFETKPSN